MKRLFAAGFMIISTVLIGQNPITSTKMELFGDHIFIHLSVDGSEPLDFIFDTGDGLPVIDTEVAIDLGLPLNHGEKKASAQGAIKGSMIQHNFIELNGIRLEDDIQMYATSLNHLEISIGRNIDGIIGYDLLQHYGVILDYTNMEFKLYDGETFNYDGVGEKFHFGLEKYIPHITGTVTLNNGEKITGEFFVNTGAGTTLDFNTKFAKKNGLVAKTGDHYSYLVKGLSAEETPHYEGRVKQFKIGKTRYENMPIGISGAQHGIQNNKKMAGIIGNRILKNFNVIFDYKNESIFLQRHVQSGKEFHVNACGFEIQQSTDKSKVLIHQVYDRGPAKPAELMVNDELLEVNGKKVSDYSLPELNAILNKAGTTVELKLFSGGAERTATLELKELI